jgi:excinuclease UvrABC ATPase subunit
MPEKQPRMIPNPLWCETCEGRGYLVADAEWEPYAVQCGACKDRRPPNPIQQITSEGK